jgi:rare lipoprotein A
MLKKQMKLWLAAVLSAAVVAGCAAPRPGRGRGPWREAGLASWYGADFHGRRTANGERYNMYAMTAAHKTLPLGTPVVVTHRESGRRIRVRVNDRGPFVAGRIIDLSYAAARALGSANDGVVPVIVEAELPAAAFASSPPVPQPAGTAPAEIALPRLRGAFAVQVGAFAVEANARRLADRLQTAANPVRVLEFQDNRGLWWRVRVGGYRNEGDALNAAITYETQGLAGFVVRED